MQDGPDSTPDGMHVRARAAPSFLSFLSRPLAPAPAAPPLRQLRRRRCAPRPGFGLCVAMPSDAAADALRPLGNVLLRLPGCVRQLVFLPFAEDVRHTEKVRSHAPRRLLPSLVACAPPRLRLLTPAVPAAAASVTPPSAGCFLWRPQARRRR